MHKTNYPINLTEKQWQVIEKVLHGKKRKRKHSLRDIFNATFYLLNTGCQMANTSERVSQMAVGLLLLQPMERSWYFEIL